MELVKRKWWFIKPPSHFEVARCKCGDNNSVWSEYQEHLWCSICNIDFIPEHNGIFDGPIPMGAAKLMGISFDRWNDELKCVECFDYDSGEYVSLKPGEKILTIIPEYINTYKPL